jgi:hypothetical protein
MIRSGSRRSGATGRVERGQILLMAGLFMAVLVAMVALVVDGGFAWAEQRFAQNGTDAAAKAGAVQLMRHLDGSGVVTDAMVWDAIEESGNDNDVSIVSAYYTDIGGALLRADGTTTTDPAQAVSVGSGTIPPCDANCAGPDAAGVAAAGERDFSTFFAPIFGIHSLSARAEATAVSGWVANPCEDALGCPLVPVTVPVTIVSCDGHNDPLPYIDPATGHTVPYRKFVHYTIPLCRNGPGNVGWIDWSPPGGGTSELAEAIRHPQSRHIPMPEWYFITETGNTNSQQVESALNLYAGQVIFIPMFDSTCNIDPPGPAVDACPAANVGGNGQSQWYHLPQFGAFLLDAPKGAFIQGNNSSACAASNGGTSCLKGMFVDFQLGGTVGTTPPDDPNAARFSGVQLIH